ncbi:MAG: plastocyanin/azurin family copper-binding protein [Armatimonadota bacterium]|nr:plastocyanin/azurin family copper-binding protein [Armatimonadota bacterium]MDR7444493.1 plastocyanin/azurin family copper-binding protein [Armatimonadota bacterium]MDR7570805.1 plastocyanin/azurin family copper-binding protein [Armatimonadota bacterium]MDR7615202.1 plastocyanin/azurin family copper-binding protein [Armatimonadota bacterium]
MGQGGRVLAGVAVAALVLVAGPRVGAQARTWTVIVGGMTQDGSVWSNAFHPRVVDITAGDTVEWRFEGFHNVAFAGGGQLPPLVVTEGKAAYINPQVAFPVGPAEYDGQGYRNSGVPPEDPKAWAGYRYRLRFTRPGTYVYTCIVHGPAMSGVVRVHPEGTVLPRDPAAVLRQGRQEQRATLQAGRQALSRLRTEVRGNGEVRVSLVGNAQGGYSLMRFTRAPLVVQRGTTVTWEMRDPFEIHAVTFVGSEKVPPFVVPQPQASGPPKLLLNPRVAAPTPQKEYAGSGYVNSGILVPLGAPGPRSYSLRFIRTGTYTYWCPIHAMVGMKGTVVVR